MEKEISEFPNFYKTAARNLMENLSFWREESHRELSKIIDLHNATVSKSINDMVEEVCHLQIKLLETEKERDGLRETLEALKAMKAAQALLKVQKAVMVAHAFPESVEVSHFFLEAVETAQVFIEVLEAFK